MSNDRDTALLQFFDNPILNGGQFCKTMILFQLCFTKEKSYSQNEIPQI